MLLQKFRCMTMLLPIAPQPLKNSHWKSLEAESSAVRHRLRGQRILQIWSLWIFYWALAQEEVYPAKPTTVGELTIVEKRFSEEHRANVLHSVALNVLKRVISVKSKRNACFSTFYKMYLLLLIIKNSLFLNILVYNFSFFAIITMNKEPIKNIKCWNTLYIRILWH